jgi:hypothetical protein
MRRFQTAAALLCVSALILSGCAGMNADARAMLQQPLSCENPQADIETLKESRPSGGKRFLQFFQGIMPPMIVISLLRDLLYGKPYRSIYLDHWRVSFGSYNTQIDKRVTELEACGA